MNRRLGSDRAMVVEGEAAGVEAEAMPGPGPEVDLVGEEVAGRAVQHLNSRRSCSLGGKQDCAYKVLLYLFIYSAPGGGEGGGGGGGEGCPCPGGGLGGGGGGQFTPVQDGVKIGRKLGCRLGAIDGAVDGGKTMAVQMICGPHMHTRLSTIC